MTRASSPDGDSAAFDLTGRTAIVTGAATGIGEAIARRFTRAGARVAVADIDLRGAEQVSSTLGNDSFAVACDVALSGDARRTVEEVLRRSGQVDILVNNAGIAGRAAPIWEQTDEEWQRILAINLTGVFQFCRAVVPH